MSKIASPFNIYHITGKVYLFLFEEMYDLCMHFLRYQEFYESPEFSDKSFTILEFMEWYSKAFGGGAFTYSKDWAGFNIPSNVIWQVHTKGITDRNKYDAAMLGAYNKISANTHLVENGAKHDDFYILGAYKNDINVLGHELAHGLYATDVKYYTEVMSLYKALPANIVNSIFDYLIKIGYNKKVLVDELQAYMATGMPNDLQQADKKLNKFSAQFEKAFKKHTRNIKFDISKSLKLQ
jgi:hypothetical protein